MIVKNEEENLHNCLNNADDYADEIIIVDTGSSDHTKEIAKQYTKNIYDFEWCDDFSRARNFSFDQAKCEYIMWLDADDFLPKESVEEIKKWKLSQEECDVLMCPYVAGFDKKFNPIFKYNRERIVKNKINLRWQDRVHEVIVPQGIIRKNEKILVYHNKKKENASERNLNIYRDMIVKGEEFSARNKFYYARELYFNGYIDDAICEYEKFLNDSRGWVENKIEAHLNLSRCYAKVGKIELAFKVLFSSFVYALPRGEVLYEIGNLYVLQGDFKKAIYWFKFALNSKSCIESGAFINEECYSFLPAMQLCYCYSKLGDNLSAYFYHKIAFGLKPDDDRVAFNEKFFQSVFDQKSIP